ncbi:DUF4097 family beta strand repeat-containing protein [Streptomyces griseus]|uniref:DUF4097 family beta strand repeat-containing protein n=1 Tax=Streptomyces griseus TaxID=1911 RepID=UPI003804A44D
MPEFTTPEPITVTASVHSGRLLLLAGDRTTTVVRVLPGDDQAAADVKAAEQTGVDYTAGVLTVRSPDPNWLSGVLGGSPRVDVTVELPAGSNLRAETVKAQVRSEGPLDEVRIDGVSGHIHLDRVGALRVDTVSGRVSADDVVRHADVNGVSGEVHLGRVGGSGVVKNVNGGIQIGDAGSSLHVSAAGGDIVVERAGPGVTAKTSAGGIRIGGATTGEIEAVSASGDVEIGVGEGTTAWIDARSTTGSVRNNLQHQEAPVGQADRVRVRARSRHGDIMIHRSRRADA